MLLEGQWYGPQDIAFRGKQCIYFFRKQDCGDFLTWTCMITACIQRPPDLGSNCSSSGLIFLNEICSPQLSLIKNVLCCGEIYENKEAKATQGLITSLWTFKNDFDKWKKI